jgi:hypothetical protein
MLTVSQKNLEIFLKLLYTHIFAADADSSFYLSIFTVLQDFYKPDFMESTSKVCEH